MKSIFTLKKIQTQKTQNKSVASITIMISILGKIFHKSFNIVIMILKRPI
jgi:hypothetical protein